MNNTSDNNLNFSLPSDAGIDCFVSTLEAWFVHHQQEFFWRSNSANTYVKIVSEVLLQRTQASKVSYFLPDFVAKYPSWKSISTSDEEEIGQVLMPLGLWRRRAKSLKSLADNLCSREEIWPSTREELESMPAVGQYLASAVLLFQHEKRASLMDASMARRCGRGFGGSRPNPLELGHA